MCGCWGVRRKTTFTADFNVFWLSTRRIEGLEPSPFLKKGIATPPSTSRAGRGVQWIPLSFRNFGIWPLFS